MHEYIVSHCDALFSCCIFTPTRPSEGQRGAGVLPEKVIFARKLLPDVEDRDVSVYWWHANWGKLGELLLRR